MKKSAIIVFMFCAAMLIAQKPAVKIGSHEIKTDSAGKILPWYSNNLGESYDHVINLVWKFWENIRIDSNGIPYYLNHKIWKKDISAAGGIGGDQISMALSSWRLLYAYSGNQKILDNMIYISDYYLAHSLSPENAVWPGLPYPYNTSILSGVYDGDMILGKGYTQPDKAGSFGLELVNLYKITGNQKYLDAAIKIANTLAGKTVSGAQSQSPLPFRVNALSGETGVLKDEKQLEKIKYQYTSNWSPTLNLFKQLAKLGKGKSDDYKKAYKTILNWMKTYPLKNNKWGPFYEDVGLWSDTQINAITFAEFILENKDEFTDWEKDAFNAIDWVYEELYNERWEQYGVAAVNEQTHSRIAGNSHTARQGAIELLYAANTGDSLRKWIGIRQLNWATYMVNNDGENTSLNNETRLTDGYGDYVRHYLKAFAAYPELAPAERNSLVKTSSVVKNIKYKNTGINYLVFDSSSTEIFRLTGKPKKVLLNSKVIKESLKPLKQDCWSWKPLSKGGILIITHCLGNKLEIIY